MKGGMTTETLSRDEIEGEVARLAPWYYQFDLDGVRTDTTSPCDRYGHRTISHKWGKGIVEGKTVLDVGCNEGFRSFVSLDNGAARTIGFDCRLVNVEKAQLVARILGYDRAEFSVNSIDAWPFDEYDVVFLCGVLYHLPEPWRAIERYCAMARETILVTSVLRGVGDEGLTTSHEYESIASSEDPSIESMMPNNARTLVGEFEKHGFDLVRGSELRWGPKGEMGCELVLERRVSR